MALMQRTFTHAKDTDHILHGYTPLLTRLLVNRGVTTEEQAELFIKPDYLKSLHDPLLLHDMEKAIVRIFSAIEAKEKIVVYADYDCDGIPGAVILHDLFTKIGYNHFSIYIPDRHDEGYGLNKEAIEQFIADGVSLVITIDLGTTDHEDIALAQAGGIDVIVTDHHLPHEILPPAFAVINPKVGDTYPEKMLCGSGVVFKLVQAFIGKYGEYFKIQSGWEKWLLDMAGLATLSDMVPLTGENRAIAHFGMQVLRKSQRPGLGQLLRKLKIDQEHLVEDDLTFMVTPRINAASRMDSPMRAFEMLSEKDTVKAGMLAEHLTKINDDRKKLVAQIMKDVKHTLAERTLGSVIVVGNPMWRVGVLGIVAGKLSEEHDKPVFAWGRGTDTLLKGSCRSNGSVNVVHLMEKAKHAFADFGGHELAGGFSVHAEHIHSLEETLSTMYSEVEQENLTPNGMIDAVLKLSDVTEATYGFASSIAPCGLGNPKPTFLFENLIVKNIKMFGKEKNHLELTLADDIKVERTAMAFFANADTFSKKIEQGEKINLIATIEKSYFLGRVTLRLRIVDIV
jgi:single-stranded-DNA-specific exonuclease